MAVAPGSELGTYHVVELLGAGGMGEVFLARDSRLDREVALKVLRPPFDADPDRLARFDREARLLASLSHPHVGAIYGVEDHHGVPFLVLELVRGETLTERLADRPLSTQEALAFAAQIAGAIEAAHEQNIVHRDLKPGNIKITPAGTVKVLDFGIAKALGETRSGTMGASPTFSAGGTGEGTIVGTAAYMSPEQARGRTVDKRADIWAFGCVLYDMLTGHSAFSGDTLSDTIAAILTREPDWARLPADTPPSIRRLLARCLEKELSRRLRDIGDARIEIEDAMAHPAPRAEDLAPPVAAVRAARPRGVPGLAAAAAVAGVALGAGALWMLRPAPAEPRRVAAQFTVDLQGNERIAGLDHPAVAIAPGDTAIAYTASTGGDSRLYVRPMAAANAIALPATDGAVAPFFSPDGQWIAFFASGKLRKVSTAGGPVIDIAEAPIGFGGSWADDNTIVYAPNNGSALWQVSAEGGTPRAVTVLDASHGEFSHRWPEVLPGGKDVVYSASSAGSWDDAEIVIQRLGSADRQTLLRGGTNPRHLDAGRLLYTRGGSIYVVGYDASERRVSGAPVAVLDGVVESLDGASGIGVSRTGSIVYLPDRGDESARTLAWVSLRGNLEPLAAPARAYTEPRVSPDGRMIAVTIGGARDEIWTYEIATNTLTEVTFEGGSAPVWSGDGQRILFTAIRGGRPNLFWKPADGRGGDERLTTDERRQIAASASADGSLVAYIESDAWGGRDIGLLRQADRRTRALLASTANETAPAFSPDGRLIAFVSDASGDDEVYVAAVSDPERAERVSGQTGTEPVWRRDGGEIFFRSGDRMLAAAVFRTPRLHVGSPRVLFEGTFERGGAGRPGYDVSPDTRFLMVRPADTSRSGRELRVFLNWRDQLSSTPGAARRRP